MHPIANKHHKTNKNNSEGNISQTIIKIPTINQTDPVIVCIIDAKTISKST